MKVGRQFGLGHLIWAVGTAGVIMSLTLSRDAIGPHAIVRIAVSGCMVAFWPLLTLVMITRQTGWNAPNVAAAVMPLALWLILTLDRW